MVHLYVRMILLKRNEVNPTLIHVRLLSHQLHDACVCCAQSVGDLVSVPSAGPSLYRPGKCGRGPAGDNNRRLTGGGHLYPGGHHGPLPPPGCGSVQGVVGRAGTVW